MTNINGQSLDLLQENIENLKGLFPEICCEGKIDFDKLKQILGEYVDDSNERYNFTWNGKGKALRLSQTPSMGTLRPCKEESKNWDTTQNMYIEGDNLEVLKLLQKSYHGKIKMIYIDPPYNTGGDFVYPDDFADSLENYKRITGQVDDEGRKLGTNTEANGRYHTDWLNMMYPRLRLARNLLTDDGVIFISIDDNEVDNLKKICNEVFGEDNFVGVFLINAAPNARDYGHIGKMHEFALFYAKNISFTNTNLLPVEDKKFKFSDAVGGFNIHPLYNSNEAFTNLNRPNLYYPFYLQPSTIDSDGFFQIGLEKMDGCIEIYPPKSIKNNIQFVWRWGREKSAKNLNKEIVGYKTNDGEYRIVQKMRHDEKLIRSMLVDTKYSSRRGTAEVEELLQSKCFSFPKPLNLIYDFSRISLNDRDICIDFFSGSATAAHAVMQLNAEDGGNRKFICVQLPEPCDENSEAFKAGYKNICEIGKERIRRAGEKIMHNAQCVMHNEENKQTAFDDNYELSIKNYALDTGFRVFKLETSNLRKWQPDYDNLENSLYNSIGNFVDGRTEQDVVYEIMLKIGLDLTYPLEQHTFGGKNIYSVALGALMICLDDDITPDVANGMVALYQQAQPETWKVVFKDNGFATDSAKTNIKEILKCAGLDEDAFTTI